MANIFKENKAVNEHPNRNNFDLSKKSNVSLKFGTLYPVYCQPVVPGDSFDINVAYNLKLMPVVFPVQTKMRAHMHFFYVRNKNLWSNWENWISNLPNATQSLTPHPYIDLPDSVFTSGSIHDFLGVPTSLVGNMPLTISSSFSGSTLEGVTTISFYYHTANSLLPSCTLLQFSDLNASYSSTYSVAAMHAWISDSSLIKLTLDSVYSFPTSLLYGIQFAENAHLVLRIKGYDLDENEFLYPGVIDLGDINSIIDAQQDSFSFKLNQSALDFLKSENSSGGADFFFLCASTADVTTTTISSSQAVMTSKIPQSSGFVQYSDLNADLYSNHLRINALPYRAYESCYWAYYNNNVVSPMTINGDVQYNRYNTNLGDGADTTNYHLFQRNYELDFLTSALPSPQQGVAPLVGMTALGDVTIEDENGITTAHAEIDNDGTITKVVLTSPAASIEHARTAMNIAASGMSINDFRQTNALQRVLETNIRKGYRYMDFIAGHFGKEPEYRELDMPEFIGGFSRDVNVSTVVSQADTLGDDSGKALGGYGGFAQVVGGTNHAIRHYCDDYGYIIGILSVVPTPCYSQLLPKHMIAPDNFLDYYFPEFSQSGLMPITYKEVAPIQSYLDSLTDNTKSLEDTFGYQRPNYDMVSAVDEVHGEFRGALHDYVINRIFSTRPELGRSFLQINPSEINDIFVNTNPDDDTIIGEIGFAVHAKRPVPRVVIPNLGR